MLISRRSFIAGTALGAATLAAPWRRAVAAPAAASDVKALIARGLEAARAAGASYADVRFERVRTQGLRVRDDHLVDISDAESWGFGVRVIVAGVWGYAASYVVDPETVVRTAQAAAAVARGNQRAAGRKVALAPAARALGSWRSPMEIDPFAVPLGEKAAALLDAHRRVLALKGARFRLDGSLQFVRQEKTFGSSEGALTEQTFVRGQPYLEITAIDERSGDFEVGSTDGAVPPAQIGWEVMTKLGFADAAVTAAEQTARRLGAAAVTPGRYDLVLAPSNLWLTIHESVGHPTELDRALGYEANYAGTSFATPDQLGKLRYGSEIVNLVADRLQPGALASCGWDDDGDAAQRWDLVKAGVLVGFQTTREQAAWIGEARGHATSYAESWSEVPFQRMPNVSLLPGPRPLTPAQLVADTKRGIYVEGNGSWSIDQQRYNFQFGGQAFTAIENGKLTRPLRHVAYQSNSRQFWQSCDAICDQRDYRLGGSLSDGKGEPEQSNPVSHGCATARFRGVNVLSVRDA